MEGRDKSAKSMADKKMDKADWSGLLVAIARPSVLFVVSVLYGLSYVWWFRDNPEAGVFKRIENEKSV